MEAVLEMEGAGEGAAVGISAAWSGSRARATRNTCLDRRR